tara:strand:+ start:69 stop:458 length:390 start_codon:yes stop_codon:yes gene_type:complete
VFLILTLVSNLIGLTALIPEGENLACIETQSSGEDFVFLIFFLLWQTSLPRSRKTKTHNFCCGFPYAERAGFEPAVHFWRTHAFQACSLSHSDTSPLLICLKNGTQNYKNIMTLDFHKIKKVALNGDFD